MPPLRPLHHLLSAAHPDPALPPLDRPVRPCADSRQVDADCIFFAWGPAWQDNARDAVGRGCALVVAEASMALPIPVVVVADVRLAYGQACVRAWGLDREVPALLGITGTDGKTTVNWLSWQACGARGARVGTLGFAHEDKRRASRHTTPPAEELCAFLADVPVACSVALEISSHAAVQHRLGDLPLAGLVITGIGHDHLDYHGSREAYAAAKLGLLDRVVAGGLVIIDAADDFAERCAQAASERGLRCCSLGWQTGTAQLQRDGDGVRFRYEGDSWILPQVLPGDFNYWNVAAAVLLVGSVDVDPALAIARIAAMEPVPGRLERVGEQPVCYVDYAHTPGAIALVLAALRQEHPERLLVCVFGCGGDRDASKRGPMLQAALAADRTVLTADNPRSEGQPAIERDCLAQLPAGLAREHLHCEEDRGAAIRFALDAAGRSGVVVVCGKGHETEQIIGTERRPWDDRRVVRELLAERAA